MCHSTWLLCTQQTEQKEIFCATPSHCWNLQHWGVGSRGPGGRASACGHCLVTTFFPPQWTLLTSLSLQRIVVLMLWKCFAWMCGHVDLGLVVAKICIILVLLCSLPVTEYLLYVKCVGIRKEKQQLPSQFLLLFCLGCDKQGHTGDLAVHSICFWGVN